jgi:hypothetical protein
MERHANPTEIDAMTRTRFALLALLATLAVAPVAQAAAAPPRIVGTPTVTAASVSSTGNGRFVSLGATVRLDRPFANATEQHRYALVAAPRLRAGERLPDALFGGSVLGRLGRRPGAWYTGEVAQLALHRAVRSGARWQVALARGNRIVGVVKPVTLRRA